MFTFEGSEYIFEYHEKPRIDDQGYKINPHKLHLYGMYRNALYLSYSKLVAVDDEIKQCSSLWAVNGEHDPLYHYTVNAAMRDLATIFDLNEKTFAYYAYTLKDGKKSLAGYIFFQTKSNDDHEKVYIALLIVTDQRKGLGKQLMDCVVSHYPAGTEFYLITRKMNVPAKKLYEDKCQFKPTHQEVVTKEGFSDKYCGYELMSTPEEVQQINACKLKPTAGHGSEEKDSIDGSRPSSSRAYRTK